MNGISFISYALNKCNDISGSQEVNLRNKKEYTFYEKFIFFIFYETDNFSA